MSFAELLFLELLVREADIVAGKQIDGLFTYLLVVLEKDKIGLWQGAVKHLNTERKDPKTVVTNDNSTMEESKVMPDSVMDSVKKTSFNVEQVRTHLLQLLSLSDPDVLAEMPPLERAQLLFLLAKATTILYTLRLRCSGVHPDDHSVKSELERVSLYQDKLTRFIDLSKAPLRPSTTLNYRAATRFIEHSLPDLTPGRLLPRNFLEKAARELLGDSKDGLQGPLQADVPGWR
ncbi:hypothetical protein Patl1_12592 [Pistacia atlantica]|uniref:Uncharacterized protein n=1 Tax=Pistacia atlantica TaxID=434234 RepID=A0ACC1AVT0_9ROSI|nr:hypothetical protein Patl1_12592 [Pistacia atlantica]